MDKATMENSSGLKALDRMLRDLRNKDYLSDERSDRIVCNRH